MEHMQVWNKCDLLPERGATEAAQQLAAAAGVQQPYQQQQAKQQAGQQAGQQAAEEQAAEEQVAAVAAKPASGPAPGSPGSQGGGASCGGLQAAAAAGLLPPAVQALLDGDAAAAGYRPVAVATSVLRRQGLQEVLAAVERKASGSRCEQQASSHWSAWGAKGAWG